MKRVPYYPVKCPQVSLLFQIVRFWKMLAEWLETAPTAQSSPGSCVAASLPPATWGAKTLQRTRAGGPKTWPVRLGGRQETYKPQYRDFICWFCMICFFFCHQFLNHVAQIIFIASSCRRSRSISNNSPFIYRDYSYFQHHGWYSSRQKQQVVSPKSTLKFLSWDRCAVRSLC